MFKPRDIAAATQTPAPASAAAILRYMMGRPLDFDPGAKYAYSNFGYNVLGRLVEKISGQPYADFTQARVLAPAGAGGFALGRSLLADRAADEVRYHDEPGARKFPAVFPGVRELVAAPDGGFHLEAMDAHGAWIANAIDYVRLVCALDGSRPPALLTPASIAELTARPAPPVAVGAAAYYGFGINIRPVRGAGLGANWWHSGSLPGTITYQVRLASGWTWAAFFNTRPKDSNALTGELDRAMNAALAAATPPAEGDLFSRFSAKPAAKE
jgi:CubicO group peptidase (beta-lactamase class C family)